jgi:hypothetical protein
MRIINPLDDDWSIEPSLIAMATDTNLLEALKGRKLLELVQHLQSKGEPRAFGWARRGMLHLSPRDSSVSVSVWIDWYDYAPLQDGLPVPHYRLEVRRRDSTVSYDARAANSNEAVRIILDAFEPAD